MVRGVSQEAPTLHLRLKGGSCELHIAAQPLRNHINQFSLWLFSQLDVNILFRGIQLIHHTQNYCSYIVYTLYNQARCCRKATGIRSRWIKRERAIRSTVGSKRGEIKCARYSITLELLNGVDYRTISDIYILEIYTTRDLYESQPVAQRCSRANSRSKQGKEDKNKQKTKWKPPSNRL